MMNRKSYHSEGREAGGVNRAHQQEVRGVLCGPTAEAAAAGRSLFLIGKEQMVAGWGGLPDTSISFTIRGLVYKKHSHPEHRQHWTRAQAHTISLLTHGQDLKGTGRQSFRGGTGRWETDLRSRQGWILEPNQQFIVRSRCLETSNLVTGSPHHPVVRDVISPRSANAHRGEVRPWAGVFHSTFRNSRASTGTPKITHRDPT